MNNGIAKTDGVGVYEDNYEPIDEAKPASDAHEDNLS